MLLVPYLLDLERSGNLLGLQSVPLLRSLRKSYLYQLHVYSRRRTRRKMLTFNICAPCSICVISEGLRSIRFITAAAFALLVSLVSHLQG